MTRTRDAPSQVVPGLPDDAQPTMPTPSTPDRKPAVPDRFNVKGATLWVDHLMNGLIKGGGILVVIAVLGIFVFIGAQIFPLFSSPSVGAPRTIGLPSGMTPAAFTIDEYARKPFLVDASGKACFVDTQTGAAEAVDLGLPSGTTATAVSLRQQDRTGALGLSDGSILLFEIAYSPVFDADGVRTGVEGRVRTQGPFEIGLPGRPIRAIAHGGDSKSTTALTLQDTDSGTPSVRAGLLATKKGLGGTARTRLVDTADLAKDLHAPAQRMLVDFAGATLVVADTAGEVSVFVRNDDTIALRQQFKPFANESAPAIASMDFLLGDVSLVFTNAAGANTIWSLFIPRDGKDGIRIFGQTKELDPLPGGAASSFAASHVNKSFVLTHGTTASLRHGTSEAVRWEDTLPYTPRLSAIGPKYNFMAFVDTDDRLHLHSLSDPHPEAGWKAYFGKVWYEGQDAPQYSWASSGGGDDYEPKLSQVPLVFGALKGTLYALLFSVPIALLAAIYVSQYTSPATRRIVKPTMEIMASLPSVVLGFIAALWLAPLLEHRVPSVLLAISAIPIAAVLAAETSERLPQRIKGWLQRGNEWWIMLPLVVAAAWIGWELGPSAEPLMAGAYNAIHDAWHADAIAAGAMQPAHTLTFPDLWRHWLGDSTAYNQRNSLIIGVAMGFAIIPIIFTIAEDALSNVPGSLRSASLALGASRWQTTMRVVLPTASPGIFSALMIGFGRAVGETMIMVMATGNTAIMDLNLFSGMRSLSANIAVELSEAPHGGTLFRTLFLGAMLLFALTFVLNTLAEFMRQRLRDKYKTV